MSKKLGRPKGVVKQILFVRVKPVNKAYVRKQKNGSKYIDGLLDEQRGNGKQK